MKAPVNEVGPTGFERLARPLLELIQHLTGLETTFVTQIDWAAQRQEVLLALNTAELQVVEGSVTSWSETMCRQAFLSNKDHSCDVPTDFPGSLAAEQLGMRSYFALPILDGDDTIGTTAFPTLILAGRGLLVFPAGAGP